MKIFEYILPRNHDLTCFQVIEHIKDDISFLKEVQRILKKNGTFILTTPNKLLRLKGNIPWNREHVREYKHKEIEKILKKAFNHVFCYSLNGSKEALKLEKNRLKRIRREKYYNELNIKKEDIFFFLSKEKKDDALDIFCCCKKI